MSTPAGFENVDAGPFGEWLDGIRRAIEGVAESDVACGSCRACCQSSQFVRIGRDEVETLARIPKALLFPAPGAPESEVVLGYDQTGACPMLGDAGCTIYSDRPKTCRTYDCRVFAAAGIDADPERPLIVERARRWVFQYPSESDRRAHDEVRRRAQNDGESRSQTERAIKAVLPRGISP